MTYQNIVKFHAALCALNADNSPTPLGKIGIHKPSGSREARRKAKARLQTITPEIIVGRIKEYQRRHGPLRVRSIPIGTASSGIRAGQALYINSAGKITPLPVT